MKIHLLFEQSGTFKKAFQKLGHKAIDYDILNDYKQTDIKKDIFREINLCYFNNKSIFDNIKKEDLIIAFFPCTYFSEGQQLWMSGQNNSQKKWSTIAKLEYASCIQNKLDEYYTTLCRLCIIAIRKDLKLIIENPYNGMHYLNKYFPLQPSIIDYDRSKHGDDYKKPTQYYFINVEPKLKLSNPNSQLHIHHNKIENKNTQERSLINIEYAKWFIKEFIL